MLPQLLSSLSMLYCLHLAASAVASACTLAAFSVAASAVASARAAVESVSAELSTSLHRQALRDHHFHLQTRKILIVLCEWHSGAITISFVPSVAGDVHRSESSTSPHRTSRDMHSHSSRPSDSGFRNASCC